MQLGLIYRSTDGHESVSLTQAAAGVSNPYGQIGNKEDWEELTQDGSTVMARPANWGQAQVYLERERHVCVPHVGQPHPRPALEDRRRAATRTEHEQHLTDTPAGSGGAATDASAADCTLFADAAAKT